MWPFSNNFFFLLSVLVALKERKKERKKIERLTNGLFFEHLVLMCTIVLMNGLAWSC